HRIVLCFPTRRYSALSWSEGLDLKDVLAIEESRETQAAEPPEFAVRDDLRHNGSEPHPAGPRRSEEHVESRADFGIAMDPSDEISEEHTSGLQSQDQF